MLTQAITLLRIYEHQSYIHVTITLARRMTSLLSYSSRDRCRLSRHFVIVVTLFRKIHIICICLPSDMSRSRISHANIVGFSLLYCSILDTTAGVATFGLLPPIRPGGRSVPIDNNNLLDHADVP